MAERLGMNDTLPHGTDTARRNHLAHSQLLCAPCRTPAQPTVRRPVVTVEPGMRWGYPHIGGVSTEAIAGMVWAGESVETVADEYSRTRAEVLTACWYEARHGSYRRRWAAWLASVETRLARRAVDWDMIPDPPSKQEAQGV